MRKKVCGDDMSDFDKLLLRDVRVTFPIAKLGYHGGTVSLRRWAKALRIAAQQLDAASQRYDQREAKSLRDARATLVSLRKTMQNKY